MAPGRPRRYQNQEERRKARKEQAWERRQHARLWSKEEGLKAAIWQLEAQKQRRNRHPTWLSNQQKCELASKLIRAAGEIVENLWTERPLGWDPEEAARQLALWLKKLHGDY